MLTCAMATCIWSSTSQHCRPSWHQQYLRTEWLHAQMFLDVSHVLTFSDATLHAWRFATVMTPVNQFSYLLGVLWVKDGGSWSSSACSLLSKHRQAHLDSKLSALRYWSRQHHYKELAAIHPSRRYFDYLWLLHKEENDAILRVFAQE